MQSTWTWSQVITSIKGVTARTSGGYSQSTNGKYSIDTTNGAWMYIPSNAYYTTGSWVNIPWNNVKGILGGATTGEVLTGKTFSSSSGVGITGTMPSYTTGNSAITTRWGLDTTSGFWMYIPNNGYYGTGHYLNVPWATCKSKINEFGANPDINAIAKNVQPFHFNYAGDDWAAFKDNNGPTGSVTIPAGCVTCLLFVLFISENERSRWTHTISGGTLAREFFHYIHEKINQSVSYELYIRQYNGSAGTVISITQRSTHVNGIRGHITGCALFF